MKLNLIISICLILTSNIGLSKISRNEWVSQCENAVEETKKTFDAIREVKRGRWGLATCWQAYERVAQCNELDLSNRGLFDLTPLSAFINLKVVKLSNNQISDLSPLAELKRLKKLTLNLNLISDLRPLSKLTSLILLNLDNNQISVLEPLSKLDLWAGLNLIGNQISELWPLADISRLHVLRLDRNQIDDLRPLENLPLDFLSLAKNRITDFSPVKDRFNCSNRTLIRGDQYYYPSSTEKQH